MSLSFVLQTVIALYMVLVEGFHYKRKMLLLNETADNDSGARTRFYKSYMVRELGFVLAIGAALLLGQISPARLGLGWGTFVDGGALRGMLWGAGLALLLPLLAARFMPRVRQGMAEQLEALGKLLPVTRRDRQYWALAGITGGITEELRFRGFLPFYLSSVLPVLPPVAAMLIAAALFGLAHWFQGWQGVWRNCAKAGFLGVLVLTTRSLYPVILFHVLIELRPLAMMWLLVPVEP